MGDSAWRVFTIYKTKQIRMKLHIHKNYGFWFLYGGGGGSNLSLHKSNRPLVQKAVTLATLVSGFSFLSFLFTKANI